MAELTLEDLRRAKAESLPGGRMMLTLGDLQAAKGRRVPEMTIGGWKSGEGKQVGGEIPPEKPVALNLSESMELATRSVLPGWLNRIISYGSEMTPEQEARLGLEIAATGIAGGSGPAARIGIPLLKKAGQVGLAGVGASLASETFDPSKEPLKRAALTGVASAVGEGIGNILGRGLNRILAKRVGLEEGAEEAYRQLEKYGTPPTAGQMTTSGTVDLLENIAEASFTGFRKFQTMREAAKASAMLDIDGFVRQYLRGRAPSEIGGSIQDAIVYAGDLRRQAGSEMFQFIDDLISVDREVASVTGRLLPGEGVDLTATLAYARKRLAESGGRNPQMARVIKWIEKAYGDGAKQLSFREAQLLRSDLLGVGRTEGEIITGQAQAVANQLAKRVDTAMMDYARKLSPDIENMYRFANQFWKDTKKAFGDRFIKSLLKQDPGRVLPKIINKEAPDTIRKIKRAILDPNLKGAERLEAEKLWREIQGSMLLKVAKDAQDTAMEMQGKKAQKLLSNYGEEVLSELFLNKSELDSFRKLLRTLEITQAGIGEALPGKLAVRFGQAGAVIGMATGKFGGKAMGFIIAPEVFKRILSRPGFIRWIALGRTSPIGSKAALRAYSKLQALAIAETENFKREDRVLKKFRGEKQ